MSERLCSQRCGWNRTDDTSRAGLFTAMALWRRFGYPFVRTLVWGGIAYTTGGILEFLRWPIVIPRVVGSHEMFHLCVLLGVALHWMFVFRIASGEVPIDRGSPTDLP